jgi:hypothetical protein
MRAILFGFAGVAPRSVVPNLIEILSALLSRATTTMSGGGGDPVLGGGAVQWMKDVLMGVSFFFGFWFWFFVGH